MIMKKFWTVFCSLALLVTGCTTHDGECHEEIHTLMGVELYSTQYNAQEEVYKPTPYNVHLQVYGVGNDSLLYSLDKSVKEIALPLNNFDTISQFVIAMDSCIGDTLQIIHTSKNKFVSFECGCKFEHSIKSYNYTNHEIDSILLLNPEVNDINAKHLRIFFRTVQQ